MENCLTVEFPPNYWIKWGTTNEGAFQTIAYHDKNNIYLCGDNTTTNNALIKKIDSTGKCKWIRQLGDNTNRTAIFSADTDSFGNLYIAPITYYATDRDFILAKYDPSGTLLWQKKLNLTGSNANSTLKISSTDYIYICGWTNQAGAGSDDLLMMKLDLSGNILWQKTLGSSGVESGYTLTLDSNENVIVTAYNDDDIVIVKYDSLGTLQWQRTIGKVKVGTYDAEYAPGVVTDSNDNIYISGYEIEEVPNVFGGTSYLYSGLILKYNSSGVLQWQKITNSGYTTLFYNIVIDSNDDLYIVGQTIFDRFNLTNWYPAYIVKLNTSGVVQWERGLVSGLSGTYQYALFNYGYSIEIDEYGDLYIGGLTSYRSNNIFNDYWPLIFKVPSDGSLLGLYSPMQYVSRSLTYTNGTYTDAASNYTESTTNFSFINSTLTSSSISCSTIDNFVQISDNRESLTIENLIISSQE